METPETAIRITVLFLHLLRRGRRRSARQWRRIRRRTARCRRCGRFAKQASALRVRSGRANCGWQTRHSAWGKHSGGWHRWQHAPPAYRLPLARLQLLHSIWQLAAVVAPPLLHGVMWSASMSSRAKCFPHFGQTPCCFSCAVSRNQVQWLLSGGCVCGGECSRGEAGGKAETSNVFTDLPCPCSLFKGKMKYKTSVLHIFLQAL